jgi:hypothetical protein
MATRVGIGKDGIILISVKPMMSETRLPNDVVQMSSREDNLQWLRNRTKK